MDNRLTSVAAIACLLLALHATIACTAARAATGKPRPLVAIIGENAGTEVTDFVIPYGVLTASGVAEVVDVAVHPGPLHLMPALTLTPKETIESFDRRHPDGADYVIVPAMHNASEPSLLRWLESQAKSGATIVGVCDGVWVVAGAGLLENRKATGHWYSLGDLAKKYPLTQWVQDRRWVRDGPVITTTGVTASLPASLALVEEIGGRERAAALARELGVEEWSTAHESARYHLTSRDVVTAAANWLAFWRWERIGIPIATGVDEISLSFTADAFGRTYRSTSVTMADRDGPIVSKRGLVIVPDLAGGAGHVDRIEEIPPAEPASSLDRTLATISRLHGPATASFVALQLEYPWDPPAR